MSGLFARVQQLGDRPLPEDTRVLRIVVVAILLLGAVAFIALRSAAPQPASSTAAPVAASPVPAPAPASGEASTSRPVSAGELHAIKRSARRFLVSYLPYSYGRAPATAILGVTPGLRAGLTSSPPRVSSSERRRRARVIVLQAEGATTRRARVLAVITDGARTYSLSVTMQPVDGVWTATAIGR